jgi:hypothetical protein
MSRSRRRVRAAAVAALPTVALLAAAPAAAPRAGDATAPAIVARSPAAGSVDVPARRPRIRVRFSEPVRVRGLRSALRLRGSRGRVVPAAVSYDAASRTATLTPRSPLAAGGRYTVSVAGVRDLAGNRTGRSVFAFTTTPVLVGAGDIADCSRSADEATAALVRGIDGDVFTTGDDVYPKGTAANYRNCYGPAWGAFLDRTHPAAGNHDVSSASDGAYYDYFGAAAGPRLKGYYSFDLGAWHVVVLNSNCAIVSCSASSSQERWLRADLAAHPALCTAAIWHHPRFASGSNGTNSSVDPLWRDLYAAGADVVLNGHQHDYERLAPVDASGNRDAAFGMRQFVVGTGGEAVGLPSRRTTSEKAQGRYNGVLKLTLHATSYDWQWVGTSGSFTDTGTTSCHGSPSGN